MMLYDPIRDQDEHLVAPEPRGGLLRLRSRIALELSLLRTRRVAVLADLHEIETNEARLQDRAREIDERLGGAA